MEKMMKIKQLDATTPASTEARWRLTRESGKLRRAIERQFKADRDRWEDR
jgi:hypothetical protein